MNKFDLLQGLYNKALTHEKGIQAEFDVRQAYQSLTFVNHYMRVLRQCWVEWDFRYNEDTEKFGLHLYVFGKKVLKLKKLSPRQFWQYVLWIDEITENDTISDALLSLAARVEN